MPPCACLSYHGAVQAASALILLGFLVVWTAGCDPVSRESTADSGARPGTPVVGSDAWLDDGKPQTGLPRMKLLLGPRELNAELALTTEAIRKGMMWRTNVSETDSMLFVFGRPHQTSFWMKNVPVDIDVAYLDPEGIILEIHRLERYNTNAVLAQADNVQYALETAPGWFQRNGLAPGVMIRTERGTLQETFFRRTPTTASPR